MPEREGLSESEAVLVLGVAVIGLGDIWRLPAMALNHGGGAFLLVYLLGLAALGLPILMAELAYGKLAPQRISAVTRAAVKDLQLPRFWLILRWSLPLASLAIIALYGALGGWSFGYVFRAASGLTYGLDAAGARALFLELAADPERSLVWHTLFWLCVGVCSAQGWRNGLLRAAAWFGGLMALLLIVLSDWLPALGEQAGFSRLLTPRWSDLSAEGVWAALTQACFTFSVGMGLIFTVGRQLSAKAHTAHIALQVILMDLVFCLFIGSAIASLLTPGQLPQGGVALVFIDVVVGLGQSTGAQTCFFVLLVLVSASSAMLLVEPFVESVSARFQCGRVAAAAGVVFMAWLAGVVTLLSFGPWRDWVIFGRGIVDWLNFLGVNILLPLNCLIIASFVGRALPAPVVVAASGSRLAIMGPWYVWLRFPVRLILIVLLLETSGLLGAVLDFFAPVELESSARDFG